MKQGKQQLIEDAFLQIQEGVLWESLNAEKTRQLKGILEELFNKAQNDIYNSNKYKSLTIKGANIG